MITLDDYIAKAKTEKGKHIYYITGKSQSEVLSSPYIAQFEDAGVDVFMLTEPVDDFLVQSLTEYKEFHLKSITSANIELKDDTEDEKKAKEEVKKDFKDLLELSKNTIGAEIIEKVELNDKLGDAIGALKTPE